MLWKAKAFIAKNRYISWFLIICLLVGAGVKLSSSSFLKCYGLSLQTREGTGIVDTLIGAVVGGVLALLGSIVTNRSQQKAQAARERSRIVYKPLYDELMNIHAVVLRDNPFPFRIEYGEKTPACDPQDPRYCLWGKIQNDSRLFLVPQKLRNVMDDLYKKIAAYSVAIEPATRVINEIFRTTVSHELGKSIDGGVDFGNILLKSVMCNERPDYPSFMWMIGDISDSQRDLIWNATCAKCQEAKSVKQLAKAKKDWSKSEEYAIELLSNFIKYIEYRYER